MLFNGKICLDIEIIRFSLPSTNNDFYGIKVDGRDVHRGGGGAAAADFLKNHRGSGAAAAGCLKFIAVAARQR